MVVLFDPKSPRERSRAAKFSLAVAAGLFILKIVGYLFTHSTAILSDALETLVNIAAASLLLYSIRVSDKPPDEEHPFGHGKADFLVASFEGGAIIAAGFFIIFEAVSNWLSGRVPHDLKLGMVITFFAAVVNAALGYYMMRVGRRTRSMPVEADAQHIMSDVWTSTGVFIGLLLVRLTGHGWIDSAIAILFAILILRMGLKLFRQAISGIMDTADPKTVAMIEGILKNPPDARICSHHKLRHRLSGGFHNVDFHIQVPRTMSIEEAHAVATTVEKEIAKRLEHASVMAHIEPCENPNCPNCRGK